MADSNDQVFDWDDGLSTGLVETYYGTVISASFGIDEDYNPETVRLFLDIEAEGSTDPDAEVEPGQTFTEAYNVGNDQTWEPLNGGKAVGRIDGKRPKFNDRSGYGVLLASILGNGDGALDNREELREELRGRGPATEAKIWEGLRLNMIRRKFSFTTKDDELVEYARMYPNEYLGSGTEGGGTTAADTEVSREDIVAEFSKAENFGAGLANVMAKFPGVENGEHATWVMDQDNGAWAEAKA